MTLFERQCALALLIVISLLVPAAAAPPPADAAPGTACCVTPKGWCKAIKRGPPGAPCACQTNNGWIQGRLK